MDLLEAQRSLEDLAYAAAKARLAAEAHEAIKAGDGAGVPAVAQAIKSSLLACSGAIIEWTLDEERKGRRRLAHDIITELDPDVLAYIALGACYAVALGTKTVTMALVTTGRRVAVEWLAKVATQVDPAFVKRLVRHGTRLRGLPACARVLAEVIKKHGTDPLDWDQDVHLALGEPLVAAVMALGTFQIVDTPEGALLRLTQEAADALALSETAVQWARPRLLPMVAPPAGWDDPDRAPYLTDACRRYQKAFGRTRGKSRAVLRKRWDSEAMKPFRAALDTLGAVAYRVDPEIVEAVEWAYVSGIRAKKLPSIAEVAVPALPETGDQDVLKVARQERRDAEDLRLLNRTLGAGLRADLANLRLLACYPEVYQPHFCDFRGRLNVVSSLSHHRQDFIRACFRFAKAETLGAHGRKWLAIHLANCAAGPVHGKLDKAPFEERVAWAEGNKDLIAKVAEDYRANVDLWADADAPFAFIQAAREWTRMLAWEEEHGAHESFPSSIVVSMDATCSGLQHYSASLRSEEEGALVNLLASDKPQDIYGVVAARTASILKEWSEKHDDYRFQLAAQQWLAYGVSRSTVKRQVMTFPYSSEVFGFTDQIRTDIMKPLYRQFLNGEIEEHPFGDDHGWTAALVMAQAIWRALQTVVVKAAEGMAWLKTTALLLARHGKHMEWDSPSGFPVVHCYREKKGKQVQTFLGKRVIRLSIQEDAPSGVVPHKQRNAAAPNFIHSLDAAHLHLTVAAMARQGITQLAMIHDSFGTVAGHAETLARTVRQEFVTMYEENDPWQEVYRRSLALLPEEAQGELSPPPAKGTLDIRAVLDSPYAFC